MSSIKPLDPEEQRKKLREFGLVMATALFVLSGFLLIKGRAISLFTIAVGAIFMLAGLFAPSALRTLESYWMKLAEKMSIVVTYIIVTLTFYVVVTPIGLFMRMLGKDLLGLELEADRESYWEPCEKDGPGTRPYLPY